MVFLDYEAKNVIICIDFMRVYNHMRMFSAAVAS